MTVTARQKLNTMRLLFAGKRDQAQRIREQARKGRRSIHDAERIESHLPVLEAILADYERAEK